MSHSGNKPPSEPTDTLLRAPALPATGAGGVMFMSTGGVGLTLAQADGRYVKLSGSTMTGQLITPELNGLILGIGADPTGTTNVAIGPFAAPALPINNNGNAAIVAVGAYAAAGLTTGGSITAIGYGALQTNAGGNGAVAVGTNALNGNATALLDTAVGSSALAAAVFGIRNTAVGGSAMGSGIGGNDNVGVGVSAVQFIAGDENTAVGNYALSAAGLNDRNIALGFKAGFYAVNSDELYVGNRDFGSNAAEKTGCIIFGVMDAVAGNQTLALNAVVSIPFALGINGKAPVVNVAAPAAAGAAYGAGEQALLNDIRTRLINFGIYT